MDKKSLSYLLLILFIDFIASTAHSSLPMSDATLFHHMRNTTREWAATDPIVQIILQPGVRFVMAGTLSFIAAAISSAGGIGGGGLFVPILIIVAGLDVKTASSYSAFMVTGGSIANVASHILEKKGRIDYDIALLSEPSMLLGVSCGVILNLVLPEWLITLFFAVFIAFSTFKTCKSGVWYWQLESRGIRGKGEEAGGSMEKSLLGEDQDEGKSGTPWMKIGMLVAIWVSFFVLHLLRGDRDGQGFIQIEVCGKAYWIITFLQIPLAVIFTTSILLRKGGPKSHASAQQETGGLTGNQQCGNLIFPVMALFAGVLGGVFGIGGGMLISPLLLQIGIEPQVTAATTSFMVLFSSTMSAVQYLLLGMEQIHSAVTLAAVCFVASLVGLTLVQQAILRHGRASLIVFSVGTVMALSTVLMTSFGVIKTWSDYTSGQSMGFNKPC